MKIELLSQETKKEFIDRLEQAVSLFKADRTFLLVKYSRGTLEILALGGEPEILGSIHQKTQEPEYD